MKLVCAFLFAAIVSAQLTAPTRNFNVTSPVSNGPYVVGQILPCTYRLLSDVDSTGKFDSIPHSGFYTTYSLFFFTIALSLQIDLVPNGYSVPVISPIPSTGTASNSTANATSTAGQGTILDCGASAHFSPDQDKQKSNGHTLQF